VASAIDAPVEGIEFCFDPGGWLDAITLKVESFTGRGNSAKVPGSSLKSNEPSRRMAQAQHTSLTVMTSLMPTELEIRVAGVVSLFRANVDVRRLFIDEISAVPNWERALKRLVDRGQLRNVLVITTGSKATDIRRGSERLPGRQGKLARTDFLFTGVSYKDFHAQFRMELGDDTWKAYLLSGASPIAAMEIRQRERVPEYFFEIIRDWIIGEIVKSGPSRQFLLALMRTLFAQGGSRTGYLKLARESGLANNTLAAEYVEQLSDLLAVIPSYQWDADKDVPLQRRPAKFHFVNLSVALSFSQNRMTQISDFDALESQERAKWIEWLVAQELFRRQCIAGVEDPEAIWYWASKEHGIDFVDAGRNLYEVKIRSVRSVGLPLVCEVPSEAQGARHWERRVSICRCQRNHDRAILARRRVPTSLPRPSGQS
jgi:predicted AAA+ superfamily ATPase